MCRPKTGIRHLLLLAAVVAAGAQGTDALVLPAAPSARPIFTHVVAGLGSSSTGTWELTITLPGAQPRRFHDLNSRNPDWKTLT